MAEQKIRFKPLGVNVLVKPDEAETKTKSGIVLTEDTSEKPRSGTIAALGTGGYTPTGQQFAFTVKVGDKVYWRYGGSELELDGVKYLVMAETELLGIEE